MRELDLFRAGGTYHVYNRAVDGRQIFLDDADRVRFLNGLVAFNDQARLNRRSISSIGNVCVSENPYVDVIAYCLMPNHFHVMVKMHTDDGISAWMQRLGDGFTKYFNKRYERKGPLFEGPYQVKRVETTGYIQHLSRYIHLNPLELDLGWNTGTRTWDEARAVLERYPWSSYGHYAGNLRIPFIRDERVMRFFHSSDDYLQFLRGFIATDRTDADRDRATLDMSALSTLGVDTGS